MTALQSQVAQSLNGLSDDNLHTLLDIIEWFKQSSESKIDGDRMKKGGIQRIGFLEGMNLMTEGYDIDECNDEIAEMFEGAEL